MSEREETEVTFTVKELFESIRTEMRAFNVAMASKADATRVSGIEKCVRDMQTYGSPQTQANKKELDRQRADISRMMYKVAGISGIISTLLALAGMLIKR